MNYRPCLDFPEQVPLMEQWMPCPTYSISRGKYLPVSLKRPESFVFSFFLSGFCLPGFFERNLKLLYIGSDPFNDDDMIVFLLQALVKGVDHDNKDKSKWQTGGYGCALQGGQSASQQQGSCT